MIRKILIADHGISALRILRTCRRLGIKSVTVCSQAEKESLHARLADEAVLLEPADGQLEARLLEVARRIGANAVHPGCTSLAANVDFAHAFESSELAFIGPSSDQLRAASRAGETAQKLGIPVSANRGDGDARLIEIPILGDRHGKVIHLGNREASIYRQGHKLLSESPAPSLEERLSARMTETAVRLAREIGFSNAATIRFLLRPDGDFSYFESEPFLSDRHAITEAATGQDLIRLQIEIAEGRGLPVEAPRIRGHAIGALLHTDEPAGTESLARTLHVWQPPPATGDLRIEADIVEGMRVQHSDLLLAELIAVDATRAGAIRKLIHGLETLWVGGTSTNREPLLQILQSREFLEGKVRLGFLDGCPLELSTDEPLDFLFAAACVLYLEDSRHAHRSILPGVPPYYRNNPWREPFMALRIGTKDWAINWRRVGHNQYHVRSGEAELDGEVLALQPGTMSVVLDGILREFQFREAAEEVYVHSPLGSRAIRRLPQTGHSIQPQTVAAVSAKKE